MNSNSSLKPYWGKPAVRNFRGGGGDTSVSSAYSRTLNGQCVSSLVHVVRLFSTRRGNSMDIYMGYDRRELVAFDVARHSILTRTSAPELARIVPVEMSALGSILTR